MSIKCTLFSPPKLWVKSAARFAMHNVSHESKQVCMSAVIRSANVDSYVLIARVSEKLAKSKASFLRGNYIGQSRGLLRTKMAEPTGLEREESQCSPARMAHLTIAGSHPVGSVSRRRISVPTHRQNFLQPGAGEEGLGFPPIGGTRLWDGRRVVSWVRG